MNLELTRFRFTRDSTLGELTIDGDHICWMIEDAVREIPGSPVQVWKVPGATAIPAGRYRVEITESRRFGRLLPILLDVPGYSGIRIHPGNTKDDTAGCLLPGRKFGDDMVLESRTAFNDCYDLIDRAISSGEEVWLAITHPSVRPEPVEG